jgi:hypothetical protein
MPIINKGVFDINSVYLRDVGNDWPTAQVISTTDIVEGINPYFSNARAVTAITPLLTTANVVETDNLYFTDERVITTITPVLTTANVVEKDNLYFTIQRVFDTLSYANLALNNLILAGDLEVQGNLVTLNVGTLNIEDKNIVLANGAVTAEQADGAGITINGADANITYLTAGDRFFFNKTIETSANLVANGLIIRGIYVADNILVGNVTAAGIISNTLVLDSITANIWNGLYTANVIESENNLFFSNARARSAFIAGRGIVIQDDGVIKSTIGTETFNTAINGTYSYTVTSSMDPALTIPSIPTNDRYLIRSMHLTNISDNTAFVSANVLYASGNTAFLGNKIPVPVGGILEFMYKPQILAAGDIINIQGFDNSEVPTSNILSVTFAVEQITNDITYIGVGSTLAASNTDIELVYAEQSFAIFESIKFVNLKTYSIPIRLMIADANNIVKSYLAYNTQVPPNSSFEILQSPKTLGFQDKLITRYSNASDGDAIAVFPSYRYSAVTNLIFSQSLGIPGANVDINFGTSLTDGTTLYYTLEDI